MKLRAKMTYETLCPIEEQLKGCVPHCVVPFLEINMENFASENRSLTVMFVNLGVDLSKAQSKEGREKIQSVMVEV